MALQRPLTGGPLVVDLLNTRWRRGADEVDLLDSVTGLAQWLVEADLSDAPANAQTLAATVHVRAVLGDVVAGRRAAQDDLNAVLARGLTVRSLQNGRPSERVLLVDDNWAVAWRAAQNYLDLVSQAPDGVRRCESEDCVLYFFDPTGRRRWCSMAGCGNRAKARRHHARQQTPSPAATTQPVRPEAARPPDPAAG